MDSCTADRKLYRRAIQELLAEHKNLTILEGAVADIQTHHGCVSGVVTETGGYFHQVLWC